MRPRLGHIQFLNCLPLYYGLVKNDVLLDVDLVQAAPKDLTRMLLDGKLDIAPIPAIEYARNAKDLVLLRGELLAPLLLDRRYRCDVERRGGPVDPAAVQSARR
jgi:predicted solute-binding protein